MSYVMGDVTDADIASGFKDALKAGLDAGTSFAREQAARATGGSQGSNQEPPPLSSDPTTKSAMPAWLLPVAGVGAVAVLAAVLSKKKKKA